MDVIAFESEAMLNVDEIPKRDTSPLGSRMLFVCQCRQLLSLECTNLSCTFRSSRCNSKSFGGFPVNTGATFRERTSSFEIAYTCLKDVSLLIVGQ